MTAEKLVVSSWNYSLKNGVYVVLSRVKKLTGLFLCKPLDKNKDFKVDEDLIAFEKRLHDLQDRIVFSPAWSLGMLLGMLWTARLYILFINNTHFAQNTLLYPRV